MFHVKVFVHFKFAKFPLDDDIYIFLPKNSC